MRIPGFSFLERRQMSDAVQGFPATWRRYTSDTRSRLLLGIAAMVLLVVLVALYGVLAPGTKRPDLPVPVQVAKAGERYVVVREQTIGTVLANSTVQLTAQVEGRLLSAEFREGQIVHRGDILFRIDPRPFQAQLQQAVAMLGRDRAQLVAAQNNKRRYAALIAQNAASAQQRDDAAAAADALAATVRADEASVALAQLNLDYTVIRSPIDGKTGPILVQPGNLVSVQGATSLVVITQFQPVKVSFSLPQADMPRLEAQAAKQRLFVSVQMHGAPETARTASVDFTSNAVDDKTGTLELRATFANADGVLVPGQLVDVAVTLAEIPRAVVVPSNAVNQGPTGRYVYVVNHAGRAEMREVTVLNDDTKLAAVAGRLKKGETVITDGQMQVAPGKLVEVARAHHKP
jgi:multidrug efflux system membrane fusion protein